jgi:O-antigen ligase
MLVGVFGYWALARSLSDRGRSLVGPVLVGALGVSALVGVLQIVLDIRNGTLAHVGGRAAGLEGNAVYFSTTLCGAFAWCACLAAKSEQSRQQRLNLAAVTFFALAIGLSGSRVSIVVMVAVSVTVCLWARKHRSLLVPLFALVGLVLSWALQRSAAIGADSAERFSSGGSEGRPGLWRASVSAIRERPLLGWGPGRVRPAVQHHFTPEWVRLYQHDDYALSWNDVHNVVLQMLITVGIVGVILLTVFVIHSMRRANFGMALAVVAISINWLLQPASLSSMSVAAIFLGASVKSALVPGDPGRSWSRIVTVSSVSVGLIAAFALITADLRLRQAAHTGTRADVRAAAAWFGDDPFVADNFVLPTYRSDVPADQKARTATARRMVAAEPDIPTWWNELAMTQFESGDLEGMRASVEKALELQPNHVRSWVQMTAYAKRVGNTELEGIARTHACDLGAPVCAAG